MGYLPYIYHINCWSPDFWTINSTLCWGLPHQVCQAYLLKVQVTRAATWIHRRVMLDVDLPEKIRFVGALNRKSWPGKWWPRLRWYFLFRLKVTFDSWVHVFCLQLFSQRCCFKLLDHGSFNLSHYCRDSPGGFSLMDHRLFTIWAGGFCWHLLHSVKFTAGLTCLVPNEQQLTPQIMKFGCFAISFLGDSWGVTSPTIPNDLSFLVYNIPPFKVSNQLVCLNCIKWCFFLNKYHGKSPGQGWTFGSISREKITTWIFFRVFRGDNPARLPKTNVSYLKRYCALKRKGLRSAILEGEADAFQRNHTDLQTPRSASHLVSKEILCQVLSEAGFWAGSFCRDFSWISIIDWWMIIHLTTAANRSHQSPIIYAGSDRHHHKLQNPCYHNHKAQPFKKWTWVSPGRCRAFHMGEHLQEQRLSAWGK